MPTIIHFVRHAQGFHNLLHYDQFQIDPILTPYGITQCTTLSRTFFGPCAPRHNIRLILSSPMRRTIATAALSFGPALSSGKRPPIITALPELQETSTWPCDTGSSVYDLATWCKQEGYAVDIFRVPADWTSKKGKWACDNASLIARAAEARKRIADLIQSLEKGGDQNGELVVVTHGGFLHYLTNDWEDADRYPGTAWSNTEVRSYTLESEDGGQDLAFHETAESRKKRGKTAAPPGKDQQEVLFEEAMYKWESMGVQTGRMVKPEKEIVTEKENIGGMVMNGMVEMEEVDGGPLARERRPSQVRVQA